MTPEKRATNIVNGFFIGGGGDDLQQSNLTKADLHRAILYEIRAAEIKALEWAMRQCPDNDEHRLARAEIRARIEQQKAVLSGKGDKELAEAFDEKRGGTDKRTKTFKRDSAPEDIFDPAD